MPKHDPIRAEKIEQLAAAGNTKPEIAKILGLSKRVVQIHCWRHGVKTTPHKRIICKPNMRASCVKMRGKFSAAVIAKELGITRNAVIGHWYRDRHSTAPKQTVSA